MPEVPPGHVLVRYFEDFAYSDAHIDDLACFYVDALPYTAYVQQSVRFWLL